MTIYYCDFCKQGSKNPLMTMTVPGSKEKQKLDVCPSCFSLFFVTERIMTTKKITPVKLAEELQRIYLSQWEEEGDKPQENQ